MQDTLAVPETERPTEPAGRWLDASVLLLYLAMAVWVLGPLWAAPGHVRPDANAADPDFFEWMLRHAVRIFTVGEHPFHTPTLNTPLGVNLLANTGLLGLTVPLAPVTWVFGPGVGFVALLTIGLAGTAGAWYHVLSRHVVDNRLAAAVGGGFAGFAPGLVNHANGHPNLVAQFLIPFIVWRALTLRTVRDGIVLGLLVTWQAFINEELLFLTALALAVFVRGQPVWTGAPWHLLNHLPLFDSVLPIRLGLVVVPVFAVLLALSVAEAVRHRYGAVWLVLVAAALLPIVPIPLPVAPTASVPVFFASGDWRRYVPAGRSVVNADTSVWFGGVTAMHWDDATGQGYRRVGGDFLGPDVTGQGRYGTPERPTAGLLGGVAYNGDVPPIGDAQREQARQDVAFRRAAIVVLASDAPHHDALQATLEQLFGPGRQVDDVWLWDVR